MKLYWEHLSFAKNWLSPNLGGDMPANTELRTSSILVSLFSGGPRVKGGSDIYYVSVDEKDRWTRLVLVDGAGSGPAVRELSRWWFQALASSVTRQADPQAMLNNFVHLSARLRPGVTCQAAVITFLHSGSSMDYCWTGGCRS